MYLIKSTNTMWAKIERRQLSTNIRGLNSRFQNFSTRRSVLAKPNHWRYAVNCQLSTVNCLNRGFTLVELLVALVITGIVISLAGSGLYALMTADRRNQIETTDRLELEQALAFMSDEIKMSQQVMTNMPLPSTGEDRFRPASGISNMQPILVLKPASNSGLKNLIIYYLADPPNDSVWLGPRVIYRWGPTLLQNGNYSDGDGRDVSSNLANTNVEYYNEVVIDRISDRVSSQANIPCQTNYTYAPPNLVDRVGFYACIALDQKSVKLWIDKQPNPAAKSQSINALVVTRSN